jgi:hypothetical protein
MDSIQFYILPTNPFSWRITKQTFLGMVVDYKATPALKKCNVGKHSQIQLGTLLNKNDSGLNVYSTLGHLFIPHVNKENSTVMNSAEVKPVGTKHIQTQLNNLMQSTT